MDDIPPNILKRVIKNLPKRTIERVVLNVSTSWNEIGKIILSETIYLLVLGFYNAHILRDKGRIKCPKYEEQNLR